MHTERAFLMVKKRVTKNQSDMNNDPTHQCKPCPSTLTAAKKGLSRGSPPLKPTPVWVPQSLLLRGLEKLTVVYCLFTIASLAGGNKQSTLEIIRHGVRPRNITTKRSDPYMRDERQIKEPSASKRKSSGSMEPDLFFIRRAYLLSGLMMADESPRWPWPADRERHQFKGDSYSKMLPNLATEECWILLRCNKSLHTIGCDKQANKSGLSRRTLHLEAISDDIRDNRPRSKLSLRQI
ncbi:hypothetical protein CAPTEDRAFT_195647 [Capitella teleta]|uniref:Uncharacterized protein n=1 Tax=Capitella teleta TaxID=283909 RepID=X1ZVB7_CAPTE|nr:hypothetical protein CAPTEDRAFT_195647 [Capitella teleta]|eukprot:ELT88362.1 hypothetical protein CAPTEDRAFT_195647 [Capitella teleta]